MGLIITKHKINNESKNMIVTKNAKYVFYYLVSEYFSIIDYSNPTTESFDFVEVGNNTVIHKNVVLGKNIKVYDGTVIGRPGFSYYEFAGERRRLNPYGNVIIKDGCNISSNCNIDRGNITNTILNENVVVDSLVHIAHDDVIGKNTTVTAGVIFSGYVTVGENCFIGVNSSFKNGVTIGNNVTVGMGSNVTKSFGDNLVLAGNPAKILSYKCACGLLNRVGTESTSQCACGKKYEISKTHVLEVK
jgi:acyl-[acyl carrier protein]--UDP-N-acetylglucosamine O-acyltransferase